MTGEGAQTIRMYGPPGTGKTTRLARRTASTVTSRGPDSVGIASFSTTAAAEIASREEVKAVLPPGAVGTLHSHAYRAIEHPDVALDPKVLADWNGDVGPHWQITGDVRGPRGLDSRDRAGAGMADTGDALLEQLDLLRARQVPTSQWPMPVRSFAKRWTAWKRERGCVDYCDMIVQAYQRARDGERPPVVREVLIIDEAQDLTPIEAALAFAWGDLLPADGRLVFALDDDQAINEWRGGDPTMILSVQGAQDTVLDQSWRVPPAVHAVAEQWISRCANRFPKAYRPRGVTDRDPTPEHSRGWAQRVGYTVQDMALVDQIERDLEDPDLPDGDIMVIASCGYMLTPLIKELRRRGIPFHNPYRPAEQSWNPLGPAARGMSTVERIWRFCVADDRRLGDRARLWTGEDLAAWIKLVDAKAAHLVHGAKADVAQLPTGQVPFELVAALFRETPEGDVALNRATEADVRWLGEVLTGSMAKSAAFPLQVAQQRGPAALVDRPRVVLGTIHSTKGAEASRVYVAPDLSNAGMIQWRESQTGRDQITRLFYVALTRAYHQVAVLAPVSRNTVPPPELLPPGLEVRR